MRRIKPAASAQFREDAIYSDLKEGHERNEKNFLNFKAKTKTSRLVVPFTEFVDAREHTHTHTHVALKARSQQTGHLLAASDSPKC